MVATTLKDLHWFVANLSVATRPARGFCLSTSELGGGSETCHLRDITGENTWGSV